MKDRYWGSITILLESKNYRGAAEVISGSEDSFAMLSQLLQKAKGREEVLLACREELEEHRQWQETVLSSLPPEDDESGATGPLRQTFYRASKTREKLLQEVCFFLRAKQVEA